MAVYQQKAPNGDMFWMCDFIWTDPESGKKRRIRKPCKDAKQRPATSRTAAEAFEQRQREKLLKGTFDNEAERDETVAGFRDRYFDEHVAKWTPSTQSGTEGLWRNHIVPLLGDVALSDVAAEHLAKFAAQLRAKGLGAKSINNIVAELRSALTVANEWGLRKLPAPEVRWEKVPEVHIEWFEGPDIDKLVAVGDPMTTFAIKSGLRLGELLALRWGDVSIFKKQVTVSRSVWWEKGQKPHEGPPKNGKIRTVPLPESAVAALKSIKGERQPDAYVFNRDGAQLTKGQVEKPLKKICKEAGLPGCGWHKLRHSYISALVSAGVPLPQVQRLAGHARIEMTLRYTHVSETELRGAVSLLK